MSSNEPASYGEINDRLKEILQQVDDDTMELDAALELFEEAVALGVRASALLEEDIVNGEGDADRPEAPADSSDSGAGATVDGACE